MCRYTNSIYTFFKEHVYERKAIFLKTLNTSIIYLLTIRNFFSLLTQSQTYLEKERRNELGVSIPMLILILKNFGIVYVFHSELPSIVKQNRNKYVISSHSNIFLKQILDLP